MKKKQLTYKEVIALAKNCDSKLKATDPRFNYSVSVRHRDGTYLHIQNAFALIYQEYLTIFSEHNGIFVFFKEDLTIYSQHKGISIGNMKVK